MQINSFAIISMRSTGDALLVSPLALSIKAAIPQARVDFFTFEDCAGIVAGHPAIDRIISIPRSRKMPLFEHACRYDVAIATDPSDRMTLTARLLGRRVVGFDVTTRSGSWWKNVVTTHSEPFVAERHVVPHFLSLLKPLRIPGKADLIIQRDHKEIADLVPDKPYVLLHPYTRKKAKYWPASSWAKLANLISERNYIPLFTNSPITEDHELLMSILDEGCRSSAQVVDRPISWQGLAALIDGAAQYIGVDTALTHVAATSRTPLTVIFGPSVPRRWAPWPGGADDDPFSGDGAVLTNRNVTVVRQPWSCIACDREQCFGGDKIFCLYELSAETVFACSQISHTQAGRCQLAA